MSDDPQRQWGPGVSWTNPDDHMARWRPPQPTGSYPTRQPQAAEITAGTVAAVAATTAGVAGYTGSVAAIVAAIVGFIAATYELLAVYTDDFPTITEGVKAGGWWARGIFVATAALLLFDHFVTGLVL
jgi:hypothetical protein